MNMQDLQKKSVEELNKELHTQLEEQFKYRMQKATGQLNQTHLLKQTRKNIARIKTVLTQKAAS